MPWAAPRNCSIPGCPHHALDGGACRNHAAQRDRARGTRHERGYDHRWDRTRRAYLQRHPWCEAPRCTEPATDVDHIDGLGPHGPRGHDWSNLQALCHSCHSSKTARTTRGTAQ